jgi:hypothetical protein
VKSDGVAWTWRDQVVEGIVVGAVGVGNDIEACCRPKVLGLATSFLSKLAIHIAAWVQGM